MSNLLPFLELPDLLLEYGGEGLDLCFSCGTCTALCPWNLVRDFNVRMLIRTAQLGLEPDDTSDVWRCATCNMCVPNCPREVPIIKVFRGMRSITAEGGSKPQTLRAMIASQMENGNPWGGDASIRNKWAEGLALHEEASPDSWMLYACCTQSYDAETRQSAVDLVKVLQAGGLPLWISPQDSVCCGCSVRETGDLELWEEMGQGNIARFDKAGAHRILTSSPHCYNAFLHDYREWEGDYEVKHYTQLLHEMIQDGRIELEKALDCKVTYHDPCYLGRHNDVYEKPRACVQAIPGVELLEMEHHHENSLCCGGGGAQIFMDAPIEERLANVRVQEALDTGAEILLTACPYCNSMFRDAIKTMDIENKLRVMDIAELVWMSLNPEKKE